MEHFLLHDTFLTFITGFLWQIYALNKVMTELENENFKKFMEEKSAETLPV